MKSIDDIQAGASVLDRRGSELGTVEAVGTGYFVLARSSLFARDLFVPFSAIDIADPVTRVVRLTVETDDLDGLAWDEPPEPGQARLASRDDVGRLLSS